MSIISRYNSSVKKSMGMSGACVLGRYTEQVLTAKETFYVFSVPGSDSGHFSPKGFYFHSLVSLEIESLYIHSMNQ